MDAKGPKTFLAILVYSLSLVFLFGISAIYHRPTWKPHQRIWMRRLDHAAIYIVIAGTSTPICLLALPTSEGIKLLQVVWTVAVFGVVQSLFWVSAPKWFSTILYIFAGSLMFPHLSELAHRLSPSGVWLMVLGGLVYLFGAIIYALKRPNPYPQIFGYHEIFHLLVIFGAGLHFLVIYRLVK